MPVDRVAWTPPFVLEELPRWPCRHCQRGILRLDEDEASSFLSAESREQHQGHPEMHEIRLAGTMFCSRRDCGDPTVLLGRIHLERPDESYEEETIEEGWSPIYMLSPLFIYPAPRLISVPEGLPSQAWQELHRSFSLYWCDPRSCANALRSTLESFLRSMPRDTERASGSSRLFPLITATFQHEPDLAERLHALRVLGNEGSHGDSNLHTRDLLDAFDVFENTFAYLATRDEIALKAKRLQARHKGNT